MQRKGFKMSVADMHYLGKDKKINLFPGSDPCRDTNGGCDHRCENDNGRPVCKCWKGYVLNSDFKTCDGKIGFASSGSTT